MEFKYFEFILLILLFKFKKKKNITLKKFKYFIRYTNLFSVNQKNQKKNFQKVPEKLYYKNF